VDRVADRAALLRLLPPASVGAELGVFDGVFSEEILSIARPKQLFLVDLWNETTEIIRFDDQHRRCLHRLTGAEAWQAVRTRLSAPILSGNVQLICAEACHWLRSCLPKSLDWVYLDDNHLYDHVAEELERAIRCVKPGGWLMGHDYCEVLPGVKQAVDEFCGNRRLSIDILTDEAPLPVHPHLPGMPEQCAYNSYAIRVP
jgi:hypothetical protein